MFKDYFCGNKISDYGREWGYVDFHAFAASFDAILNNEIMGKMEQAGYYFDPVIGCTEYLNSDGDYITFEEFCNDPDAEEEYPEVFQFFIVSDAGAELIKDYNVGPLWYCEELDMYIWGITHWGTGWDYVLTDIPCEKTAK